MFSPEYADSCLLGGFNPNVPRLFSMVMVDPHPGMVDLNPSYELGVDTHGTGFQKGPL
jgi:hypothetical protein